MKKIKLIFKNGCPDNVGVHIQLINNNIYINSSANISSCEFGSKKVKGIINILSDRDFEPSNVQFVYNYKNKKFIVG